MTDQQLQGMIYQLGQKIDDLESRVIKIERIVKNIEGNTAQMTTWIRQILSKLR
jgi:hypothetical protein